MNSTHRASALLAFTACAATAFCSDYYWGGGAADIADGTPLPDDADALSGEWNGTLLNWAADPDGSTYRAFDLADTAAVLHFGAYTGEFNALPDGVSAVYLPGAVYCRRRPATVVLVR